VREEENKGMIRHIVLLRLSGSSEEERRTQASLAKEKLEALAVGIDGVVTIEVREDLGFVPGHWHAILFSEFKDNASLDNYQAHPRHIEVVNWLNGGVVVDRAIIDYKTD
jgi:hypothetical protein